MSLSCASSRVPTAPSLDVDFHSQLACSNCGRWVEASGSIPHNFFPTAPSPSSDAASGNDTDGNSGFEEYSMRSDVLKRPIAPLASYCYCLNCRGLICSLCISSHIEAMACPQCLSLHPVSNANASSPSLSLQAKGASGLAPAFSSASLSMNSLFSNRCKKCSTCPHCSSPALGLRSLSIKECPESIKPILFPNPASLPTASPASAPAVSFFYCSFCRWSSIDSLPSANGVASSALQSQPSSLLFAESTAKLISKTLHMERQTSHAAYFNALVQERRAQLSAASAPPASSKQAQPSATFPFMSPYPDTTLQKTQLVQGLDSLTLSPGESSAATSHASPLLNMAMMKRQEIENRLNHPNQYRYTGRGNLQQSEPRSGTVGIQLTDAEKAKLAVEYEGLDEAWKINQENPTTNFVSGSRDAIAPLHLPASQKSMFKNIRSPIAHLGKEEMEVDGLGEVPATSAIVQPERIPLFSICSRKCMKCERVLVKPSSEGGTLSAAGGAEAFAALPDFKRRHSALSFTPMIDVKAANGYDDYKPSLDFDNWNMISLTLTNPPAMPALHITLSSRDKRATGDGDSVCDTEKPETQSESVEHAKEKSSDISSQSTDNTSSICQVDCNGCDTWILEDEPINLDESYGEPEEKPAEPPAWMSHPGVPTHLQLLESDTENPAISSRKSSQVTMVVLIMPESKKFDALRKTLQEKKPLSSSESGQSDAKVEVPIICEMELLVKWPSPTETHPENMGELRSPFRVNLSKLFEVHY